MSTAMHAGTGTRLGQRLGKGRLEGSLPGLKRNRGSLEMLELDASCTTNDLLCPQTVYFRPPCRPHGSRGASDLRNPRWKENPGARRARGRQRLEAGSRGQQPHVVVDVTDLHSLSALANAILARWLAGRPPDGGRWRSCACVHFGKQIAGVLLLGGGGAASGLRAWHCCDSRLSALRLGRATLRYGYGTDPAALARRHISTLSNMHTHYLLNLLSFLFVRSCSTSFQ